MRFVLTTSVGFFICLSGCFAPSADAKSKKLDDKSLSMAKRLAKDREAAFAGDTAMPLNEFKQGLETAGGAIGRAVRGPQSAREQGGRSRPVPDGIQSPRLYGD